MDGIGRDSGSERLSPRCKRRNSIPASMRALAESGGVLISPRSQASGFSGRTSGWAGFLGVEGFNLAYVPQYVTSDMLSRAGLRAS